MLSRLLPRRSINNISKLLTSKTTSLSSLSHQQQHNTHRRLYNDRIDASRLQITLTDKPKAKSPYDELKFGAEFSDHMLEIDWNATDGWKDPVIRPYGKFSIDPAASVFHYALEAFEGLKAYRDESDKIRLFRPNKNWERMNRSCQSLEFPSFDNNDLQKCVDKLLTIEKEWIPNVDGYSLYLRPTIISTYPFIGVGPSKEVKLYIILSPVGPYYPEGFAAVSLWATDNYVRAWPGGVGGSKLGSNYGPTIRAQMQAAKMGYSQVMWLFPTLGEVDGNIQLRHRVEEVGTMNIFVYWRNKESGLNELVTPPTTSGTILPGVTRDSVIDLTKGYNEFNVREKAIYMDEIVSASKEGRLYEVFGAGTAAIISPVKSIGYKGVDIEVPLDKEDKTQQAGPLARRVWKDIVDIQYGRVEGHPWSVVVDEK